MELSACPELPSCFTLTENKVSQVLKDWTCFKPESGHLGYLIIWYLYDHFKAQDDLCVPWCTADGSCAVTTSSAGLECCPWSALQAPRRDKGSDDTLWSDTFSSAKAKKMGWRDVFINYNVAFGSEFGFKLKCWIARNRNVVWVTRPRTASEAVLGISHWSICCIPKWFDNNFIKKWCHVRCENYLAHVWSLFQRYDTYACLYVSQGMNKSAVCGPGSSCKQTLKMVYQCPGTDFCRLFGNFVRSWS